MVTFAAVTPKRFTVEDYHRLIELGFLTEQDRVELIKGELMQMVAKGTPHTVCNTRLFRELTILLQKQAIVRSQEPIILSPSSEPEPDLVIARYRPDDYLTGHPQPTDILLLVEIADATLKYDQQVKLPLYAECEIYNYWIFNLVAGCLEAYTQPYQDLQGSFGYANKQIFLPNTVVNLPNFPDLSIDLSTIFPNYI
ncbi:Uma2 family endonuclease [Aetokthonos hydrillicola Thurmond2011]|jgi:Uma2 family endonuclease|uniref:Uma2 family endonuclease n=1 Tax=Aetokthonos hydrillicola Thurmond2011 TaxID=2712845 RepID=A0AAP5M9W2_9CYAN|nr:Uma2 family endonuclease [Aetokthonos hydrillicola]MBO3460003.1 Uma2 family endonuclease [Aetokthonos hydrillicola CCALA 1050]MBW4584600.1 Uma2 family endonuclease [Aetokthonos hydrillicola CCALA 1050]MDR9895143.1 Uma2 family endonuclease [Aetokthonos hydrillicola Thurmond2011]